MTVKRLVGRGMVETRDNTYATARGTVCNTSDVATIFWLVPRVFLRIITEGQQIYAASDRGLHIMRHVPTAHLRPSRGWCDRPPGESSEMSMERTPTQ